MQIGIMSLNYDRFGSDRYRLMYDDGYRFCDFDLSNTDTPFYQTDKLEREKLILQEKELADKAGIAFSQVHGPWRYPPQDGTEEDREERLEKMKICLELARLLESPYMVIHPIMPFGTKQDPDYKLFFDMNVEFYKKLIPCAKQNGVIICIENMPMSKLNISPPKQTLDLIRALDSEWVQMCLDTGHSIVKGVQPGDAVALAGEYIKTLHVHDNGGDRDRHLFPYAGIIDWDGFAAALKESGFNGVFSVEAECDQDLNDDDYRKACRELALITRGIADKI